jgi:hypothetical protein
MDWNERFSFFFLNAQKLADVLWQYRNNAGMISGRLKRALSHFCFLR